MAGLKAKKLSLLSQSSQEDFSKERQSLLMRELELLLDLNPRALNSCLLALPRELRDHVLGYVLPDTAEENRPELHTCLWGADMVHEPWRHDIFGYATSVPKEDRLHPWLLLINRQLHDEFLDIYFRRSKLTLHAELRNSRENNWHFNYSPHVLQLPMLKFVTHVRLYTEWNYIITKNDRIKDQVRMTNDLMQAMDKLLAPLQAVETIELSVLFFWRYRSGKYYNLSMRDLFDLEDVFKRHAENRWLQILRTNKYTVDSPNPSAGVGYKLSSERKGTDQSGAMDIFVSQNLEDAMRYRRHSNVDFYGNYGISDPLPQPSFRHGAMI
ncbi:uncharacterized protein BDR25DRAFT_236473 [Lindgomyces ingoldianus]|uniref:Uncharacterized protein n=1 Tax=Lindgomyces ingoldianus TaxID=673940 RepID=A0ACB6QJI2_9PLEO|nr:uncharacterized protein BDR25DRAFT_236473 [Lindgomyces ingoldianus]KAF2466733.1 hypothetical protein BDR25DRAFT_236473 [Lindgomyces ingoldianus]